MGNMPEKHKYSREGGYNKKKKIKTQEKEGKTELVKERHAIPKQQREERVTANTSAPHSPANTHAWAPTQQ